MKVWLTFLQPKSIMIRNDLALGDVDFVKEQTLRCCGFRKYPESIFYRNCLSSMVRKGTVIFSLQMVKETSESFSMPKYYACWKKCLTEKQMSKVLLTTVYGCDTSYIHRGWKAWIFHVGKLLLVQWTAVWEKDLNVGLYDVSRLYLFISERLQIYDAR